MFNRVTSNKRFFVIYETVSCVDECCFQLTNIQQSAKSLIGARDGHASGTSDGGHGSIHMVDPAVTQIQPTHRNLSQAMDQQHDTTVVGAARSALSSDPGRWGTCSTISWPSNAIVSRNPTAPNSFSQDPALCLTRRKRTVLHIKSVQINIQFDNMLDTFRCKAECRHRWVTHINRQNFVNPDDVSVHTQNINIRNSGTYEVTGRYITR